MAVGTRMQQRRATEATWTTSAYVLAAGELGITTDTGIIKIGDGVNAWSSLPAAFGSRYLPLLGTAADSSLLGGVSPANYVKFTDTATAATADKIVKRLSDGRVKSAVATEVDDAVNLSQLTSSLVSRTVTAALTLALTDVGKRIEVSNSSYTAFSCTIPPNSSVAFPVGSFVDIVTTSKGPTTITAGSGVTINGQAAIYGGGSSCRLVKTATDTWRVMNVCLSPGPILHRRVNDVTGDSLSNNTPTKMRLDGADSSTYPFSNNADTLGAGEQWSSADNYKAYCRRDGWYRINGQFAPFPARGGRALVDFRVNNAASNLGGGVSRGTQYSVTAQFTAMVPLHVGDYIEMYAYQDSGSTDDLYDAEVNSPSFFEWAWHRPL